MMSQTQTPHLNPSRWSNFDKLGDIFGARNFANHYENQQAFPEVEAYGNCDNSYDPYPSWSDADGVPISRKRIQSIFMQIQSIMGFQADNTKNLYDYLLKILDSRASRMTPIKALRSVHADYIGGINSNYRKWYFGSQMDIEDSMTTEETVSGKNIEKKSSIANHTLEEAQLKWAEITNSFLPDDCIIQLALYLLIWGEANNIRFMPECICFIFKISVDFVYSLDLDLLDKIPAASGSFLDHAITPIYNYHRDQLYDEINGQCIFKNKDHAKIVGYDDINQTFWFHESLCKIELFDKSKLMDHKPHQRYLYLCDVNWATSVKKTYFEYRSWFHVIANFNRIWNIHIGVFWYYLCFNSSTLYTENYSIETNQSPNIAVKLTCLSLAGSLVSMINIVSLICSSLSDSIRELSIIKINNCIGETIFGSFLCEKEGTIILALLILTDLILFFLDTYLWYIIWNTLFSLSMFLNSGVSIWTPWRNAFSRLPQRILSKVLNSNVVILSSENERRHMLCKIWNSVVISMYREHLISIDQLESLTYQQSLNQAGDLITTDPSFFIGQEDGEYLPSYSDTDNQSEAIRRLSFFAHSLSAPIPKPLMISEMPSFSVLIPHYSEKITLSLKEVIRRDEEFSNITMLEYLKHLYPSEWRNFVRDSKLLANEKFTVEDNLDGSDLPFNVIGFKSATPEYILRTRIWASLRTQTLFRTISGFMNYSRAIKLLYSTESQNFDTSDSIQVEEANVMAQRKFKMVVSLQKMKNFTEEQEECKEFLLRTYPELQVAYLDVEVHPETGKSIYYSALIDGYSEILETGQRKPKYRIRLSGNPILGDGKSDNQNHAIIFCRGEYVQLIDANQDNYIEECLKIRSVLSEFDEYQTFNCQNTESNPVAIVGTREYIFSENIGVLGDVTAGKEQIFGTLFARTLANVAGRLHYGHPDFLNLIFMTTLGGVSKSQKGLHLNEDIYAGLNAMMRGGRIKHCEYFQCGKGRDLGFSSIMNFTTKIGSGMGEQMLSREYFYLGFQLPWDRFLSFFYAHPGFHLNNVFIMMSIELFMFFGIHLAAITNDSVLCSYNESTPFTDPRRPQGCLNLIPVINWIHHCVLSIFVVFGISFIPLCIQELIERGIWKCTYRISKHLISLSPMFEVFVCRIYSQSLIKDLSIGGAKYIATKRNFATTRAPFFKLYLRFSHGSFHHSALFCGLLFYMSLVLWKFSLLYFWCTIVSLIFSPFWFNPNQFNITEFFIDYINFMKWLTLGNVEGFEQRWITNTRNTRMTSTGSKFRKSNWDNKFTGFIFKRVSFHSKLSQISSKFFRLMVVITAYLYANSQNNSGGFIPANSILRLLVVSFGPILINSGLLAILFMISLIAGPVLMFICPLFAEFIANFCHFSSVFIYLISFDFLLFWQNWNISKSILGIVASFQIQDFFFTCITFLFLTREFVDDKSTKSWWTGGWLSSGLGWHILTQPLREYICKITEQSNFALDFLVSHLILLLQIPILFLPYIDTIHSILLLWVSPDKMLKKPMFSRHKRRKRRIVAVLSFTLFACVISCILGIVIIPVTLIRLSKFDIGLFLPSIFGILQQPGETKNTSKGLKNYLPP
ncbi:hypothetical protein DAMA08_025420 [Martiniozyma asiatica (nom. inval.)]|nr:hypothetical protein DAMA08_025420 [Martiniozyma asiatica]